MTRQSDIQLFATIAALADALRGVRLAEISVGAFRVPVQRIPTAAANDALEGTQVYRVDLGYHRSATLRVALFAACNESNPELGYAKLMCFGSGTGFSLGKASSAPIFSVNLTTADAADPENPDAGLGILPRLIFTGQRALKEEFGEKAMQNSNLQSQLTLLGIVRAMGYEVTDEGLVSLGAFDPQHARFLEPASSEEFLDSFLAISLLKGHLQGNKRYRLPGMPYYGSSELAGMFSKGITDAAGPDCDVAGKVDVTVREARNVSERLKREVKMRDGWLCVKCGRGPAEGVRLHVDHVRPIAAKGGNGPSNLQTLCHLCNLGKSCGADVAPASEPTP